MLWNEDNSPMEIPWVKEAYSMRRYAFVADYMRFWALYNYGGIYLDTDMLLLKPIDDLLNNKMFIGREDAERVSMGIIGMPPKAEFCKECLDYYNSIRFDSNNLPIITIVLTHIFEQYGFQRKNITQTLSNGLIIYETAYFYPVHYRDTFDVKDLLAPPYGGFVSPDMPTYTIHLWNKSWSTEWELFEKKKYKEAFLLVWSTLKNRPLQSFKYYKKLIKYTLIFLHLYK